MLKLFLKLLCLIDHDVIFTYICNKIDWINYDFKTQILLNALTDSYNLCRKNKISNEISYDHIKYYGIINPLKIASKIISSNQSISSNVQFIKEIYNNIQTIKKNGYSDGVCIPLYDELQILIPGSIDPYNNICQIYTYFDTNNLKHFSYDILNGIIKYSWPLSNCNTIIEICNNCIQTFDLDSNDFINFAVFCKKYSFVVFFANFDTMNLDTFFKLILCMSKKNSYEHFGFIKSQITLIYQHIKNSNKINMLCRHQINILMYYSIIYVNNDMIELLFNNWIQSYYYSSYEIFMTKLKNKYLIQLFIELFKKHKISLNFNTDVVVESIIKFNNCGLLNILTKSIDRTIIDNLLNFHLKNIDLYINNDCVINKLISLSDIIFNYDICNKLYDSKCNKSLCTYLIKTYNQHVLKYSDIMIKYPKILQKIQSCKLMLKLKLNKYEAIDLLNKIDSLWLRDIVKNLLMKNFHLDLDN